MQPAMQPVSTAKASSPMKGSELRAQLRMQLGRNPPATPSPQPAMKVAPAADQDVPGDHSAVIDYTLLDLRAFDTLIDEYVALAFREPGERNTKRLELLAARKKLAPARVKAELAELRTMVDELRADADRSKRATGHTAVART